MDFKDLTKQERSLLGTVTQQQFDKIAQLPDAIIRNPSLDSQYLHIIQDRQATDQQLKAINKNDSSSKKRP